MPWSAVLLCPAVNVLWSMLLLGDVIIYIKNLYIVDNYYTLYSMTAYKELIQELIDARKKTGQSQSELDKVIGCAEGLVSKWECGMRKPGAFLFSCWADALECKIQLAPKKKNESA